MPRPGRLLPHSQNEICGVPSGIGTDFSPRVFRFCSVSINPPMLYVSSSSTRCSYSRTKGRNQGTFQKAGLVRNSRSILLKSTFIFFSGLFCVTLASSQCRLVFILILLLPERKRDENWKLSNEKLFFQTQISK